MQCLQRFYCFSEIDDDEDKMIIYRPASFSFTYILGSMLLCFLSMLCKEQGITVLVSDFQSHVK